MSCEVIQEALEREALGLVTRQETGCIAEHLPRCAPCAELAAAVRSRYQALICAVATEAEVPGILDAVGRRLEEALGPVPAPLARRVGGRPRLAVALAGAAAVFLVSALLGATPGPLQGARADAERSLPCTRLRGLP